MTDPTTPVPSNPATATAPAAGDQADPLAVLEDILKEAKQKKGEQTEDNTQETGVEKAEPESPDQPEEVSPEEKARLQAQEAALQAQAQARDASEIEAQRQKISQEVMNSPQYQAKVSQEEEKKQESDDKTAGEDGFDIKQLGHDKI
jgi:hypothetical protein